MTNFFVQQEKARRKTGLLVVLVVFSIVAIVAILYAIVSLLYLYLSADEIGEVSGAAYRHVFLGFQLLPWTAGITLLVVLVGSLARMAELSEDGSAVAKSLNAREIPPTTLEPHEKRLRDVVEEMAIAAGIRVPRVFLLDGEWGLNAFAAGNRADDATIIVTRGLLETLTRVELQAVVGHEFSHILNGDMRQNIKLIGLLAGIFCLSQMGIALLRIVYCSGGTRSSGRNDSRQGGNDAGAIVLAFFALGAVLYVVGLVGYFFGRIIQSAISRQREYLADASAVQFTRNPAALASALKCIGASQYGSRLSLNSLEIAHMCFAPPHGALFAAHPPLAARILRLEPSFQGDFGPMRNSCREPDPAATDRSGKRNGAFRGFRPSKGHAAIWGAILVPDIAYDTNSPIYEALHQPLPAMAFLLASAFAGTDPALRPGMVEIALKSPLGEWSDGSSYLPEDLLAEWERKIASWPPHDLRAGCELAADALRSLAPEIRERICEAVSAISDLDACRTPFELALTALLERRLRDRHRHDVIRLTPAIELKEEAAVVFTLLCIYSGDRNGRSDAWNAVMENYPPLKGVSPSGAGLENAGLLAEALEALSHLPYSWKGRFMEACHAAIEQDGLITQDEEDLLRAIEDGIRA